MEDVCELEQVRKQSTSSAARRPLVPTENKNGASRQARTREISSRNRSPAPSAGTGPNRNPSPNGRNVSLPSSLSTPRRATSVEKMRPCRSSSSTPVQETVEGEFFVRKQHGSKLPESLWPSTMRNLSVSFRSDAQPLPSSKRERLVSCTPSTNVTHKLAKDPAFRKPTPERSRSPLTGKKSSDQLENSKPAETLPPRLADQHRWPSRSSGKVSNALNRSIDLVDKSAKFSSLSSSVSGLSSHRRLSLDGATKSLSKSSSDLLMQLSRDDSALQMKKLGPTMSSDRLHLVNAAARALSSSSLGMHPRSQSVTRGNSPSQSRVAPSSRGSSPSRVRQPSPSRQPQISTSVLSFIVDIKKGKKSANYIDDVHQLRMLYNRQLQWRFTNAHVDATLQSQKIKAEKMLCCVSRLISDLWDSILKKKMVIQQLNLKSKIYSLLNNHLSYLDEWASIERDHVSNLTSTIQDLQASTICIPVTASARGEMKSLKAAMCSAVDVMQTVVSLKNSVFPKVEEMNRLLTELADMAAYARASLDECESVLGTIDTLQVEEYSLRAHLLQVKQTWEKVGGPCCVFR